MSHPPDTHAADALAPEATWIVPNAMPPLHTGEVQLWRLSLAAPDMPRLVSWLSPDEQARRQRFARDPERERFTRARAALRWLLGALLRVPPAAVRFQYAANGRPELATDAAPDLRFNLSHSGDMALIGLTRDVRIGVDLEPLERRVERDAIVDRWFSRAEAACYQSLSRPDRVQAFARGWTAKEAYLKAVGTGIAGGLDQVEVALEPGRPARLLRLHGSATEARHWSLIEVRPAPGWLGMAAVEGPMPRVRHLTLAWELTRAH